MKHHTGPICPMLRTSSRHALFCLLTTPACLAGGGYTLMAQTGKQLLFTKLWQVTNGTPDSVSWTTTHKDKMKNFITCGNTLSTNGYSDILLVKYNIYGELLWQVTIDGPNHFQDYGVKVVTDDSLNIYVAAATYYSPANNFDYTIIKPDANGTILWQTYFNSSGNSYDVPTALTIDNNRNIYVTGVSYNDSTLTDYLTLKIDSAGAIVWHKRYDYLQMNEMPADINYVSGRVYVVGASGNSLNDFDIATVGYDAGNGYQGYINRTGGAGLGYDKPMSMCADQDGNLYITGAIFESNQYDIKVMKLDSSLNTVWQDTFDVTGFDDIGNSIKLDQAGNVYVAGSVSLSSETKSGVLLKYSNSGTLLWSKYASDYDENTSEYRSLVIQNDGLVLAGGTTLGSVDRDMLVHAYNQGGKLKGTLQHKGLYKGNDEIVSITAVNNRIAIHGLVAVTDSTATYMTIEYRIDTILQASNMYDEIGSSAAFWENRGQLITNADSLASGIKYYTQSGYALYFTDSSYSYVLARAATDSTVSDTLWRVEVTYPGAKQLRTTAYGKPKSDYLNYYLAHCPNGVVNVTGYNTLLCPNISRNVDIEYRWFNNRFAPRIVVKPGGSPADVFIRFSGADSITVAPDSSLLIHTGIGNIRLPKLIVYESDEEGNISPLNWPGMYMVYDSNTVGLFYDSYDDSRYLIYSAEKGLQGNSCPDKNLVWCTYYDSNNACYIESSKSDNDESVYLVGVYGNGWSSYQLWYPHTIGIYLVNPPLADGTLVFVNKYNYLNQLKFTSLIGGTSFDKPTDIIYSNDDAFIITGSTLSTNFPISGNSYQSQKSGNADGFIAKFSSDGTQYLWGTFFGGISYEVFHKSFIFNNRLFVVGKGNSSSPHLEHAVENNAYYSDEGTGLLCEFTLDGTLLWSTSIGDVSSYIDCKGIIVLNTSELMIAGETTGGLPLYGDSPPLDHTYHGNTDIFVMTFNSQLQPIMSRYIGGNGNDLMFNSSIGTIQESVHGAKGMYIVGKSNSLDYPLAGINTYSHNNNYDGIITLVKSNGVLNWSTYWGGSEDDVVNDISTDFNPIIADEKVYFGGNTNSLDMYCFNYDQNYYWWKTENIVAGERGFFVKMDLSKQLVLSTYIHGTNDNIFNQTINNVNTVLAFKNVYYCAGGTNATADFPICINNGGYIFPGYDYYDFFQKSPFVAKYIQPVEISSSVIEISENSSRYVIYPNPNYTEKVRTTINNAKTASIYNLQGQLISELSINNNSIDLPKLMNGCYIITITDSSNISYNFKLIIL